MGNETKDLIYIHLHASERFVVSCGISFAEFYTAQSKPLQHLLLLKHRYKDADFNMNTLLEYVNKEDIPKFVKKELDLSGDFCWIDFEDESGLNAMNGQELAELLYLGHCKHHLRQPFYRMLKNDFVYLSHDDYWFNKTYYRKLDYFFDVLGTIVSNKLHSLKAEKNWFNIRKKNEYEVIPNSILIKLSSLMAEGLVFSFEKLSKTRQRMEIPMWVIGDYVNMDEVAEDYIEKRQSEPDAVLVYTKKTKEWSLELK